VCSAFDTALAQFADFYAIQGERDHGALVRAIRSGRVKQEDIAA
jgi:hypothetical protein